DPADQPHQPDPRASRLDRAEQVRDQVDRPLTATFFRFSQIELPWALGPPEGRYLMRRPDDPPDAPASHVLVVATLGAPERRRLLANRSDRQASPEPEPAPVTTGRATIVDVAEPLTNAEAARDWLTGAGEEDFAADLAALNR